MVRFLLYQSSARLFKGKLLYVSITLFVAQAAYSVVVDDGYSVVVVCFQVSQVRSDAIVHRKRLPFQCW